MPLPYQTDRVEIESTEDREVSGIVSPSVSGIFSDHQQIKGTPVCLLRTYIVELPCSTCWFAGIIILRLGMQQNCLEDLLARRSDSVGSGGRLRMWIPGNATFWSSGHHCTKCFCYCELSAQFIHIATLSEIMRAYLPMGFIFSGKLIQYMPIFRRNNILSSSARCYFVWCLKYKICKWIRHENNMVKPIFCVL